MTQPDAQLAVLIGSRICHDLISPVGAINNGLELLELSGYAPGPEATLIRDSCASAQSRIRFFRIAFGAASATQMISRREAAEVLAGVSITGRHRFGWKPGDDIARDEVQLAFLGCLIMETALPTGGAVSIHFDNGRWRLQVDEGQVETGASCWKALASDTVPDDLRAEHVQFAFLPRLLDGRGRDVKLVAEGAHTALII